MMVQWKPLIKDIYSHKVDTDFLLFQYQLQTLFSRCNIDSAETRYEEINNWKSNDYRREKKPCHFTPFFIL